MASTGRTLPDEILSLICQQLGIDRDFVSLRKCALCSKSLADPALRTLYQYHEQSPSFIQSDELDTRRAPSTFVARSTEQDSLFRRWTILWRSIILSTFEGKTYKPYCWYLRVLDLRNLSAMLEDYKFTGPVRKTFFAGELKPFFFQKPEYSRTIVDVVPTINAVGDAISQKTNLVEEITGHLSPGFLPRWIARSPRLKALVLWHGDALGNGAGGAIQTNCEHFNTLTIREWLEPQADELCAEFFTSLHKGTLEYFEMISFSNIGKLSFDALTNHASSLKELKLGSLSKAAMENLHLLRECNNIHTLELEDSIGSTQLEALNNDVFVEVVEWLSSCTKLRDLSFKKFFDGPSILAQVLTSPNLKLNKLSLERYVVNRQESAAFHTALSDQKSLESVLLKGDGVDTSSDDLSIMVEALCNLTSLRELVLKDVSDEFEEHHIANLALNLPLLEDFWTSGGEIGATVLAALTNLKALKNLTLYAMTQFSCEEILDFLDSCDGTRQSGFNLSLMASDPEFDLTDEEQDLIREVIRTKFEGRFDFVLWREAELSDSEDD